MASGHDASEVAAILKEMTFEERLQALIAVTKRLYLLRQGGSRLSYNEKKRKKYYADKIKRARENGSLSTP